MQYVFFLKKVYIYGVQWEVLGYYCGVSGKAPSSWGVFVKFRVKVTWEVLGYYCL